MAIASLMTGLPLVMKKKERMERTTRTMMNPIALGMRTESTTPLIAAKTHSTEMSPGPSAKPTESSAT